MLTPATNTGNSYGGGGHSAGASGFTTRTKKYAVKKAPKSIASERDEEEHPERRRVEPRAAVRRGRPVVGVPGVFSACALTCRSAPGRDGLFRDDVLDRHARVLAEPLDDVPAQPSGALPGEGRNDHLVDALVLDHLHRGRVRVGVRDLPVGLDPLVAERREGGAQTPLGLGVLRPAGIGLRAHDQEARPAPRRRADAGGRAAARRARSRSRPRGRSPRPCGRRRRRRHAWNGRSPASRFSSSTTFRRRSQPEVSSGCVETISSSICSCASTSSTAARGPPSKTSPCAGIPAARSSAIMRSSRRPADARREFWYTT